MPAEFVLDASVAAKVIFQESGTPAARSLVLSGSRLIAPDLIFAEMASIAAKQVRRYGAPQTEARRAISEVRHWLSETIPLMDLVGPAFDLAAQHGFSAYDATYLALAQARDVTVMTADVKLVRKAIAVGLSDRVTLLGSES